MAEQGFRKHSTVLFNGEDGFTARKWSGLLRDHTNLTNHQLCVMLSEAVEAGSYAVYIIPDSEQANTAVDTGLRLDLAGRDSAIVTFTGVIRGLRLVIDNPLDATVSVSAVLSSFSRMRRDAATELGRGRYDYVSSDLSKDSLVTGFTSFGKETLNHSNLAYHQLFITADEALEDTFNLRIIPDSSDINESVSLDKTLDFAGTSAAMVYFGGIFRGIHLENTSEFPSSNVPLKIVLSSFVERPDEIVYDYIGLTPELSDHVGDVNNPHQTSWDNLLNKPTYFPVDTVLEDTLVLRDDQQLIVWERFDIINDGSLELNPGAELVVLHDRPEARAIDPDFTYNVGGELTQIDYAAGEQKLFTYNGSGQLTQVDSIRLGTTLRKAFTYTGGGELDYITETWL